MCCMWKTIKIHSYVGHSILIYIDIPIQIIPQDVVVLFIFNKTNNSKELIVLNLGGMPIAFASVYVIHVIDMQ